MNRLLLNRHGAEPLYRQISRLLEQELRSHYESGDLLPPEQDLAARFSVNRHTLRRAVDELVALGLLDRIQGKGTFVLQPALDYRIGPHTRFSENLEALGLHPTCRITRRLLLPASGGVARRLAVAEGTRVILFDTLREVDGSPYCLISHFLPYAGLEAVHTDYQEGSLHQFLQQALGIHLERRESLITAILPVGDDARLLRMPRNQPLLRVKSVNLDARTQRPIEYSLTRWRADRVQLHIQP